MLFDIRLDEFSLTLFKAAIEKTPPTQGEVSVYVRQLYPYSTQASTDALKALRSQYASVLLPHAKGMLTKYALLTAGGVVERLRPIQTKTNLKGTP